MELRFHLDEHIATAVAVLMSLRPKMLLSWDPMMPISYRSLNRSPDAWLHAMPITFDLAPPGLNTLASRIAIKKNTSLARSSAAS